MLFLICFQTARADWIKQNANTLAWLHDIYFFNETKGFIAGSNGTFLETKDGGKTWTKRKNFTEDTILQIYFSDDYSGWLLCERDIFRRGANSSSYLMKTTDGGENWEKVELKDGGRSRITKIFFNQKGKGLAIGESGAFFELQTDGTWERSPSPIRYLLLDGAFFDDTHGAIVGAGSSVYFTEDAGASWNPANVFGGKTAKFSAVFFADQKSGWAVGTEGKIFQTVSGGKTWREQKSGVTKDLADVFFKSSSEGWAVGGEGTILHTKTAGNVWALENTNVKHKLEKIIFAGKKGFAVGFGGTVLTFDESAKIERTAVKPVLQKRN
ncbi:MAG TPA: YCF48-related protein [Pyrinomonadaceae bacterium]|nr:YCF48-related protein [Pyrinomonadaceae bacterium]